MDRGADLHPLPQPRAHILQHAILLGFVEDLVVEAVVDLERPVLPRRCNRAAEARRGGQRRSELPYMIRVGTVIACTLEGSERTARSSSNAVLAGSLP